MVEIFIGLPRTGKTFRAVHYIKTRFLNSEHKEFNKHKYLYTNIGGFKFEKVNEILLSSPATKNDDLFIKEAKELNWNDFYEHLKVVYDMAQEEKTDDELIDYLKQHDYYPALVVVDECYRYFTKKSDPILVWFLAYHGHLGFDVIFITQSVSLMHSDYKQFTEFYYEALPKSKGFSNNVFRYEHKTNDNVKFSSDKLKADKEIFELYKSGDIHKPKKIIYKFLIAGFVLVCFLVFMIYSLFSRLTPETNQNENNVTLSSNSHNSNYSRSDTYILNLRCNNQECWNVDSKYQRNSLSINYILYLVKSYDLKLIYHEIKNEVYKLIPANRGYQKITLASFTDFVYEVPISIKQSYLQELFIPKVIENDTSLKSKFIGDTSEPE